MTHSVSGGPGQAPPPPGSEAGAEVPKAAPRIHWVGIIVVLVVVGIIIATSALVISKLTSNLDATSNDFPAPFSTGSLDKSGFCERAPSLVAQGNRIVAVAAKDLAQDKKTLPSVDGNELQEYVVNLAILQTQSPVSVQMTMTNYLSYFSELVAIKNGQQVPLSPVKQVVATGSQLKAYCG